MNAIWPLWAAAVALLLVALAGLIWPLLRDSEDAAGVERGAKDRLLGIYRAQREELEQEFERQMLSAADRTQALDELQRRLLDDSAGLAAARSRTLNGLWPRRVMAGALALLLPLSALGLYLYVGDPRAAATIAQGEAQSHANAGADVDAMVNGLAARLAQSPDDLEGWMVLARSREVQDDFPAATQAYQQAIRVAEKQQSAPQLQAKLQADLADALASSQDGALDGPVLAALDAALRLDPQQPKALALSGTAALRRGDRDGAKEYWQRLLVLLEPGTDMALRVQSDLQRLDGEERPVAVAHAAQRQLSGSVMLAPALAERVKPGSSVFIVASAAATGRLPVAVVKLSAEHFPIAFSIDDRNAMSPDVPLSRFEKVTVEAWISDTGAAQRAAGQPSSRPQTMPSSASGVALVIDSVAP